MATKRTSKQGGKQSGRGAATRKSRRKGRGSDKGAKDLLLRGVDPDILQALQDRAERSGRSLQQELHIALRAGVRRDFDEARAKVDEWHARLRGRELPDTTELIREDRER